MQTIPFFQFLDDLVIIVGASINLKYGFMDIRIKSFINTLDLLDAVFSEATQELILEELQSLFKRIGIAIAVGML
jgi:hypothetical protein